MIKEIIHAKWKLDQGESTLNLAMQLMLKFMVSSHASEKYYINCAEIHDCFIL